MKWWKVNDLSRGYGTGDQAVRLGKGQFLNSPVPAHCHGEPVGIPSRSVQEKAVSVMRKWE